MWANNILFSGCRYVVLSRPFGVSLWYVPFYFVILQTVTFTVARCQSHSERRSVNTTDLSAEMDWHCCSLFFYYITLLNCSKTTFCLFIIIHLFTSQQEFPPHKTSAGLQLHYHITLCTNRSLNQTWTDRIWGPAGSCLWPGRGDHRRGPLPPASACGCRPSDGTDTGTHPPAAADTAGTAAPRSQQRVPPAPMSHLGRSLPPVLSEL